MNHWKKLLSGILTLAMLTALLAVGASAAPKAPKLTFEMVDETTLEITGLPDDLEEPTADLYTEERTGSKKVTTYLAEDAPIVDGALVLDSGEELEFETEYNIVIYDDDGIYYEGTFVLTEQEDIPEAGFTDVKATDWYYNAVNYCAAKGLASGIGNNRFGPSYVVTRAQTAQILYALEGKPAVTKSGNFPDVPSGKWYSNAINWAANNGVMKGYTTGNFLPNAGITRQQFMATIYNYVKLKNYDATRSGDISGFKDINDVTPSAVPALQWAVGHHVMDGTEDHRLMPKATTSRAEMAVILASFDRNIAN